MPLLLPPTIVGPVSVLTATVRVSGALSGATVQLRQAGAPIGSAAAGDTGVAYISVPSGMLTPGAALTATQVNASGTSDPGPAEPVLGPPSSLSPLAFLTEVHTCVDGVILGGTIEGARVEVEWNGSVIGKGEAGGTQISVALHHTSPLGVGDVLVAQQSVTWQGNTIKSPPVKSLPAQLSPDREQSMPAPQIQAPIYECDSAVLVTGLRDGATFTLTKSSGPLVYEYFGNAVWANTGPLHVPDGVSVVQEFRSCHASSPPFGPVPVTKATQLPAPVMQGPLCADVRQVTISSLRPGATVTIYVGRGAPGFEQSSMLGQANAATETQTFALPPNLNLLSGPPEFLYCFQERCGIGSPDSNRAQLSALAAAPGAPQLDRLVECARQVQVASLAPGSTVRLLSDQADTPVLSAPTFCGAATVVIPTYRPLRAGETVTARVSGCGAGAGSQASKRVDSLPALNPPEVHNPTRIWQTSVRVDKCVPGARVHAFVNDVWRGAADAASETVWVPCGKLGRENKITAQQVLCADISGPSVPVFATLGKMKVSVTPAPIIKSASPVVVTVNAVDADDGHQVNGTVGLPGGVTKPANTQFAWTFPPGQPGPAAVVSADGYDSEPVSWPLQEPPAPTPKLLTLDFANNVVGVSVSKVEWAVARPDPGGVETSIGSPTGPKATLSLPKPPGGGVQQYYVQCTVTFGSQTAKVTNGLCPDGSGRAVVGWDGNPLTAYFRLYGAAVYNAETGKTTNVFWVAYTGAE